MNQNKVLYMFPRSQTNNSKLGGYDEEWDDMYDMGDTSWKVRRSAVQLTDTLILTHPELLLMLAETLFDKLVKRFTEQEQNVKLDVFSTLSDFLKAIVYGESSIEAEENLEELLGKPTLNRLKPSFAVLNNKLTAMIASLVKVFADKKITAALKAAASGLLLRATQCTPDTILNHLDSIIKLIEINFSQSSNSTELRSNMLQTLRAILKIQIIQSKPQIESHYARIYKLIQLAIEDQNFKVSSEGYKALTVFYKALRPNLSLPASNFSVYIKPVIPTVVKTLKETDIDEEV